MSKLLYSVLLGCLCKQAASAAIPASASYKWTPAHEVVYRTLLGEAAGEGRVGINRVADTLVNRAGIAGTSPDYEAVKPWQYSVYNRRYTKNDAGKTLVTDPTYMPIVPRADPGIYSYASNLANQVVSGRYKPTSTDSFYYNPAKVKQTPAWARNKPGTTVGNHIFFTNIAPYTTGINK